MTGNQAFALSMPLITAAVVGLVGLFVRKPWNERKRVDRAAEVVDFDHLNDRAMESVKEALDQAERQIQRAQQQLIRIKAAS